MSIPVITISREYGSGGRAIGERLAKELGIPFYDKELIFMAAKESGLSEEYIKKTEQMKSTSFLYGLYMGAQQLPMNDQIFLVQSKIIRQVASEGPCVIVGRCADYVLLDQGSGGTGKTFDWSLAEGFTRPFLLAGGLGTDNLAEAIERLSPWAVDLSSSLEIDGLKDRDKIIEAVNIVRSFEQLK